MKNRKLCTVVKFILGALFVVVLLGAIATGVFVEEWIERTVYDWATNLW